MWIILALVSAICAALTTIFVKLGVRNVDSSLATALRTCVVLVMSWGVVFINGAAKNIGAITPKSLLYLGLSGLATGASWMTFNRALQLAPASKVAPIDKMSIVFVVLLSFIILNEAVNIKTIIGTILIFAGTLVMIL